MAPTMGQSRLFSGPSHSSAYPRSSGGRSRRSSGYPSGHERRFRDLYDASGLPPTPERSRQRSKPTLRARFGHRAKSRIEPSVHDRQWASCNPQVLGQFGRVRLWRKPASSSFRRTVAASAPGFASPLPPLPSQPALQSQRPAPQPRRRRRPSGVPSGPWNSTRSTECVRNLSCSPMSMASRSPLTRLTCVACDLAWTALPRSNSIRATTSW
jgi:hypothetical protein